MTLRVLAPSSLVRRRLPTISTGKTRSVRMASWTAVRVRLRGRFWVWVLRERVERLGRGRMRREARIRTWRSENFFSSSRVRLKGRGHQYDTNDMWVEGFEGVVDLPLLDAVESLQGRDGDKDDNSLLAVTNLDLLKITKLACELPDGLSCQEQNPWTASRPIPPIPHCTRVFLIVCVQREWIAIGSQHLSKFEVFRCRQTVVALSVE